jgi:anti-sigma factor RsiW
MMGKNEPNIDELLNSFLDGELDPRHQTEVQRLIKHDEKIARRLLELQKCRRLVSSLPYTGAPQELLENIKASLSHRQTEVEEEIITPPAVEPVSFSVHKQPEGARRLFFRRIAAAAAMFALVAVLAAVVYSIIAPVPVINKPVAVEIKIQPREIATAVKPAETVPAKAEFSARLELKTTSPSEVLAFINKAVEFNIPLDQRITVGPEMLRESHVLACSRQNLKALMDELGTVWNKIDSAELLVNTDSPGGQIVIDAVTPAQIIEIAKQDNYQTQIETAKFFAVTNDIAENSPGREVMVAINESTPHSITIPKPVLTSNQKPVTKADEAQAAQKVLLTIVVTGE